MEGGRVGMWMGCFVRGVNSIGSVCVGGGGAQKCNHTRRQKVHLTDGRVKHDHLIVDDGSRGLSNAVRTDFTSTRCRGSVWRAR
jgi:hypothetical protein